MQTKAYVLLVAGLAVLAGVYFRSSNKQAITATNELTQAAESVGEQATSTGPIINNENKVMIKATFTTNLGAFTIEFLPAQAPKTVENFIKLAGEGFYNGTRFHRVIKDFMIQGGDPQSKDIALQNRWGTGGPGYQFADEISAVNHNDVGTIAMANAGPNTNGSQFFINTAANNFLDGKHTVFGKVSAGMDVVKAIEANPTGPNDRPIKEVVIEKITLE